jgi:short-subunit dehydrogenase
MSPSIAVFGAGPGLGQAVARRYAQEGWRVVLVGRRPEPLNLLVKELTDGGATAGAIPADLADTAAIPALARRIGDLDAIYYGVSAGGFTSATTLTAEQFDSYLPLAMHTPIALVREFLPAMLDRGEGAILTAQGGSAQRGLPNLSGPGPALAAQRNYLQSLEGEVAGRGVYVGRLYIGAAILGSAWHAQQKDYSGPTVDPAFLADQLWTMHASRSPSEIKHPMASTST